MSCTATHRATLRSGSFDRKRSELTTRWGGEGLRRRESLRANGTDLITKQVGEGGLGRMYAWRVYYMRLYVYASLCVEGWVCKLPPECLPPPLPLLPVVVGAGRDRLPSSDDVPKPPNLLHFDCVMLLMKVLKLTS